MLGSFNPLGGLDGYGDDPQCAAVLVRDLCQHAVRTSLEHGRDRALFPAVDGDPKLYDVMRLEHLIQGWQVNPPVIRPAGAGQRRQSPGAADDRRRPAIP